MLIFLIEEATTYSHPGLFFRIVGFVYDGTECQGNLICLNFDWPSVGLASSS